MDSETGYGNFPWPYWPRKQTRKSKSFITFLGHPSIIKVEHRLFCFITKHWQGKPLVDVQTVVNLIQSTTTDTGLSVVCMLDKNIYETGIKVADKDIDAIDIEYIGPHHGWSYIIKGFKL